MIKVGKLWGCLVICEVTSMSTVLLSFCLHLLAVSKSLISLTHDCMSEVARIYCPGEHISVIVCHQQMNGV